MVLWFILAILYAWFIVTFVKILVNYIRKH